MSTDRYFYIDANNRQQGPVDASQLKKLKISPSTKIWKRGMKQYVEAGRILPELFEVQERTATPRQKNQTTVVAPDVVGRIVTDASGHASQFRTPPKPKEDSKPKTETSQPQPRPQKIDPNWKTFAIIQLVAVFVFFLPCSIIFELLASAAMDTVKIIKGSGPVAFIGPVGWFIAKYWPFVTILIAGICSIISVTADNLEKLKSNFWISLTTCIITLILGAVQILFPYVIYLVIVLGLIIGALWTTISDWWEKEKQ